MKNTSIFGLILALSLLLAACGGTPAQTQVPTTEYPAQTTVPETTIPKDTTPETVPQDTAPGPTLHSGIREDGSFDGGTLFIGDSLTYGMVTGYLPDKGLLGDARYMAMPGATPLAFLEGPILSVKYGTSAHSPEFEGLYMKDAVAVEGERTTAVYFMMGTNYSKYVNEDTYIQILDILLESCPNATVYLQLIPCEKSPDLNYEAVNQRIQKVYEHYLDNSRVRLIDTNTAIGYHLTSDGIHLNEAGQACWYQALLDYAAEHDIPQ